MKKLMTLVAVAAVMAATSSQAQIVFNGGAGDSWFTGASWDGGVAPGAGDDVWLNTGGSPTVDGAGAVGNNMTIGLFGFVGSLTVDAGGDLTAAQIIISNDTADSGSVLNNGLISVSGNTYLHAGTADFVNNGTLNSSVNLILGNVASGVSTFTNTGDITVGAGLYPALAGTGTFNMLGGTVNTAAYNMNQAGTGHLQLDGGVINATGLGLNGSANNTMDITAGTMIIDGDRSGDLLYVASLGYITAYGGSGTVLADYDNINPGQTTLYAIPEPATLGLVGLMGGGLLWIRKRFTI
ncbi:MAG: PEP-CTERM sorting domain-containing protein [Verrucomicrobiota bacterium]